MGYKAKKSLFLGQVLSLIASTSLLPDSTWALTFNIPTEDLVVGRDVTVEWVGVPALGAMKQSLVLYKEDKPIFTACEGFIAGSGKCSFVLTPPDGDNQVELSGDGYKFGFSDSQGVAIDFSDTFVIKADEESDASVVESASDKNATKKAGKKSGKKGKKGKKGRHGDEEDDEEESDDDEDNERWHDRKNRGHRKHNDADEEPNQFEKQEVKKKQPVRDETDVDMADDMADVELLLANTDEDITDILDKTEAMNDAEKSILLRDGKQLKKATGDPASNGAMEPNIDGSKASGAANPNEAEQKPQTQVDTAQYDQPAGAVLPAKEPNEQAQRHDHLYRNPQHLEPESTEEKNVWKDQLLERIKERKKIIDEIRRRRRLSKDPMVSIQPVVLGNEVVELLPDDSVQSQEPASESDTTLDHLGSLETKKEAQQPPAEQGSQQQHPQQQEQQYLQQSTNLSTQQQPQSVLVGKRATAKVVVNTGDENDESSNGDVSTRNGPVEQWKKWFEKMTVKARDAIKDNFDKLIKYSMKEDNKLEDTFPDDVSDVEDAVKKAAKHFETELKKQREVKKAKKIKSRSQRLHQEDN
ncbi:hypothetical protein BGZ73_000734 [Actinomortierella ambigua]|nr:hypothetical protein BGZ73_000734 [Actinomortierella ambigua]